MSTQKRDAYLCVVASLIAKGVGFCLLSALVSFFLLGRGCT